jgi:mannose-1-phosphate guanylyltransferase
VASNIPAENIFAEPTKRDTAPAIAMGAALIARRDPQANMLVLPADQLISDINSFHQVLNDAIATAEALPALVTIGIRPTWPCPSYGYIERGERTHLPSLNLENPPFEVARFREKPATELAESFLEMGNFSWNAGIFIWRLTTLIDELTQHSPPLATFIHELINSQNPDATIAAQFANLPALSIDYALMEKATRVLNIEAPFDWDDVGSWISVGKYLEQNSNNNQTNTPLTTLHSENNIVFNQSGHGRVALLGVSDLIIVQTEDALLIADRHQADDIKKLVGELPPELL